MKSLLRAGSGLREGMASNLAIMEGQRRHSGGYYVKFGSIYNKRQRTDGWNMEQVGVGDSGLGPCSVIEKLIQISL